LDDWGYKGGDRRKKKTKKKLIFSNPNRDWKKTYSKVIWDEQDKEARI
jgi:hypothetical protein